MIYRINNDNRKKVRDILKREGKFVRSFRNEEDLVEIYNFPPSSIVLDKDKIEIISQYKVSELHSKLQLEEAGINLEETR